MNTPPASALTPPDRLNEDWRFGRPHVWAQQLLQLLDTQPGDKGNIALQISGSIGNLAVGGPPPDAELFPSIGSAYIVQQTLAKQAGQGLCLSLADGSDAEHPFTINCEAQGLFLPIIDITIESGAHAHILERHAHKDDSACICLRRYTVLPGASLSLELQETGSGNSRSLNITCITCVGNARVRHISSHSGHAWAREETIARLLTDATGAPELLMLSANRLCGEQTLDQRTLQLHSGPGGKSRLLYKNVLDGRATAIFGGNIRVESGAHETDAYLTNRNLMLSESACVHSLPGLEILADRVRCSHGSATAPMDAEQLFYMLSRGIDEQAARSMLAEGFLGDVREQFRSGD